LFKDEGRRHAVPIRDAAPLCAIDLIQIRRGGSYST
jgi:hypothetical protein